jgi:hypothetical protein
VGRQLPYSSRACRLVEQHADVGKGFKGVNDAWLDLQPLQSAEAAAERRDRDRIDLELADTNDKILESRLDVLELRRVRQCFFVGKLITKRGKAERCTTCMRPIATASCLQALA